MVLMKLLTFFF